MSTLLLVDDHCSQTVASLAQWHYRYIHGLVDTAPPSSRLVSDSTDRSSISYIYKRTHLTVVLDVSQSMALVDPTTMQPLNANALTALTNIITHCANSLVTQHTALALTVIAHSVDAVRIAAPLIHSCQVNSNNLRYVLDLISKRFADVHNAIIDQLEGRCGLSADGAIQLSDVLDDIMSLTSTVPQHALHSLCIITDGVVSDGAAVMSSYNSSLMRLQRNDVTLSIVQVSDGTSAHHALAFIPDIDTLYHAAIVTHGTYLDWNEVQTLLDVEQDSDGSQLSSLQTALLTRTSPLFPSPFDMDDASTHDQPTLSSFLAPLHDFASLDYFDSFQPAPSDFEEALTRQCVSQYTTTSSLQRLLYCRVQEGFRAATYHDDEHDCIFFRRQWQSDTLLYYTAIQHSSEPKQCAVTIHVITSQSLLSSDTRDDELQQAVMKETRDEINSFLASIQQTDLVLLETAEIKLGEGERRRLWFDGASFDDDNEVVMPPWWSDYNVQSSSALSPAHRLWLKLADISPTDYDVWFNVRSFDIVCSMHYPIVRSISNQTLMSQEINFDVMTEVLAADASRLVGAVFEPTKIDDTDASSVLDVIRAVTSCISRWSHVTINPTTFIRFLPTNFVSDTTDPSTPFMIARIVWQTKFVAKVHAAFNNVTLQQQDTLFHTLHDAINNTTIYTKRSDDVNKTEETKEAAANDYDDDSGDRQRPIDSEFDRLRLFPCAVTSHVSSLIIKAPSLERAAAVEAESDRHLVTHDELLPLSSLIRCPLTLFRSFMRHQTWTYHFHTANAAKHALELLCCARRDEHFVLAAASRLTATFIRHVMFGQPDTSNAHAEEPIASPVFSPTAPSSSPLQRNQSKSIFPPSKHAPALNDVRSSLLQYTVTQLDDEHLQCEVWMEPIYGVSAYSYSQAVDSDDDDSERVTLYQTVSSEEVFTAVAQWIHACDLHLTALVNTFQLITNTPAHDHSTHDTSNKATLSQRPSDISLYFSHDFHIEPNFDYIDDSHKRGLSRRLPIVSVSQPIPTIRTRTSALRIVSSASSASLAHMSDRLTRHSPSYSLSSYDITALRKPPATSTSLHSTMELSERRSLHIREPSPSIARRASLPITLSLPEQLAVDDASLFMETVRRRIRLERVPLSLAYLLTTASARVFKFPLPDIHANVNRHNEESGGTMLRSVSDVVLPQRAEQSDAEVTNVELSSRVSPSPSPLPVAEQWSLTTITESAISELPPADELSTSRSHVGAAKKSLTLPVAASNNVRTISQQVKPSLVPAISASSWLTQSFIASSRLHSQLIEECRRYTDVEIVTDRCFAKIINDVTLVILVLQKRPALEPIPHRNLKQPQANLVDAYLDEIINAHDPVMSRQSSDSALSESSRSYAHNLSFVTFECSKDDFKHPRTLERDADDADEMEALTDGTARQQYAHYKAAYRQRLRLFRYLTAQSAVISDGRRIESDDIRCESPTFSEESKAAVSVRPPSSPSIPPLMRPLTISIVATTPMQLRCDDLKSPLVALPLSPNSSPLYIDGLPLECFPGLTAPHLIELHRLLFSAHMRNFSAVVSTAISDGKLVAPIDTQIASTVATSPVYHDHNIAAEFRQYLPAEQPAVVADQHQRTLSSESDLSSWPSFSNQIANILSPRKALVVTPNTTSVAAAMPLPSASAALETVASTVNPSQTLYVGALTVPIIDMNDPLDDTDEDDTDDEDEAPMDADSGANSADILLIASTVSADTDNATDLSRADIISRNVAPSPRKSAASASASPRSSIGSTQSPHLQRIRQSQQSLSPYTTSQRMIPREADTHRQQVSRQQASSQQHRRVKRPPPQQESGCVIT